MIFKDYLQLRNRAFQLIKEKSGDEMRYFSPINGQPYWTHLMNVHNYLLTWGVTDPEILIASLLHDIVEDSDVSVDFIAEEFTQRVSQIVEMVTKHSDFDPDIFYTAIIESEEDGPKLIKVADRIDNILTNYCYSEKSLSNSANLIETEKYFIPMAESVGCEKYLLSAIEYYKSHFKL